MVHVSQEFLDHLKSFNRTSFALDYKKKHFIYEIINLGDNFIGTIYDHWDINFAEAMINAGAAFNPSHLMHGLYTRNYTVMKAHIDNIKNSISIKDYSISNDILNAMYSNIYIKRYDSIRCFYPPAMLANITKTNRIDYGDKIYKFYKSLYESNNSIIKDILDVVAIAAINSPNITLVAPITDGYASKYAYFLNISTQNELKVACMLPFSDFNDDEACGSIHELTHLEKYYLFQNKANPYKFSNDMQKQEYNYAAKQMINNITSMMQVYFSVSDVQNMNITSLEFKDTLLKQKDIVLYKAISSLSDPVILDLVSSILFPTAKGSISAIKYIKALYKSEILTKNISNTALIALERLSDWAIYPNDVADVESAARHTEILCRYNKLNHDLSSLAAITTYWKNNDHDMIIEMKSSLNLPDCTADEILMLDHMTSANDVEYFQNSYVMFGIEITIAAAIVGLTLCAFQH